MSVAVRKKVLTKADIEIVERGPSGRTVGELSDRGGGFGRYGWGAFAIASAAWRADAVLLGGQHS